MSKKLFVPIWWNSSQIKFSLTLSSGTHHLHRKKLQTDVDICLSFLYVNMGITNRVAALHITLITATEIAT